MRVDSENSSLCLPSRAGLMSKRIRAGLAVAALTVLAVAPSVEARGRLGSHRVGGTNSHGKGSHYVGGH